MSISAAIVKWLEAYGDIVVEPIVISTDKLGATPESYALFKTAQTSRTPFVDGSADVSEYYYLLVRNAAKTNTSRVDTMEWLEKLEAWIRKKNFNRELPELGAGRECYGISVYLSGYLMDTDSATSAYQVGLKIDYTEGKV